MWSPILLVFTLIFSAAIADLTNTEVVRTIYADSHIVRIDDEITVDLPGSAHGVYNFPIDSELHGHLSYIEAKTDSKIHLPIKSIGKVENKPTFSIEIPEENQGKRFKFIVSSFYIGLLRSKPSEILQSEKHYVELVVNIGSFFAYPSKRVTTTVVLGKGEVLFYPIDIEPVKKSGAKIKYGPFENLPPFDKRMAKFNYESTFPFLAVTNLERSIEISHWGNIAVENRLSIRNYGAKLTGSFSRLDYQRGIGHQISVAAIKAVLPASARDIYYRDEIGNISTSSVRSLYSSVEVDIIPRFPLFGGWKTFIILGYNVPTYENLYRKGDRFALKMNIMDFLYDDLLVDEMTLRVVLPETVSNVKIETPFEVERLPDEVLKTYLDTSGRTVLVMRKKNLIENHIQDFTVYYDFNAMNMLREPLMLITVFLLIFLAIIVYVRLDFSISEDKMSELEQRAQASVDEIVSLHNRRSAIYQTFEDTVSNYKSSRDHDRFKSNYRKVDSDCKAITQKIAALQPKIREFWSEGADKVAELQKLDQEYNNLVSKGVSLAESVISGKLSKPQYQSEDSNLSAKKVALVEKMDAIIESL